MSSSIQEFLLGLLSQYGTMMFSTLLFLGALGIPIPGTLLIFTSGIFVRQGLWSINQFPLVVLILVLGDLISFLMGKYLTTKYIPAKTFELTSQFLFKWGGLGIFLTRWLITPIAIPVNWILAGQKYSITKFLFWDIIGESMWLGIYGTLGYYMGHYWEQIGSIGSTISIFMLGILAIAIGMYLHKKH